LCHACCEYEMPCCQCDWEFELFRIEDPFVEDDDGGTQRYPYAARLVSIRVWTTAASMSATRFDVLTQCRLLRVSLAVESGELPTRAVVEGGRIADDQGRQSGAPFLQT
jgi:hypothetical protein